MIGGIPERVARQVGRPVVRLLMGLVTRSAPESRAALAVWAATRAGMVVLAWMAGWLFLAGPTAPIGWLARWDRWDAGIFAGIARDGYFGAGTDPTHVAFFPGLPGVLAVLHGVVGDWTAAGLVVSLAAGAVAAGVLGRLAGMEVAGAPASQSRALTPDVASPDGERPLLLVPGTSADAPSPAGGVIPVASWTSFAAPIAADPLWDESGPPAIRPSAPPAASAPGPVVASPAPVTGSGAPSVPAEGPGSPTVAAANATLFFALAPAAVFLTAGYSESLFAALAFPAWLAARRDRWVLALLLAAGASAVRVNGLFLAVALLLEFLLAGPVRRSWRQAPLFLLPLLPVLGYAAYLHHHTGDWLAWQHAQAAGWLRGFSSPRRSWDVTWTAAFGQSQNGHVAWVFQLELAAVVVGVALTGWLLARRRWPEALYVGLSLAALGTTTWYMSVPRAMLLWWPLWTGLGAWASRRPAVRTVYVCCVAPVMVGVAVLYLNGQWAG